MPLQPQLPQLPGTPPGTAATDTARDTVDFLNIGRAAERILSDSLHTVPEQLAGWVLGAYATFLDILPRLVLAVVVAAVILALTVWLRAVARRRAEATEESTAETGAGVFGLLIAITAAAAIVGADALAAATLTFTLFYVVAAALQAFGAPAMRRTRAAPEAVELAITVLRYAIIIVGVVEALAALGLELGGVIAGLGILGLAVGLAAQDSLSNLIAGFTILWDRSLRVGDWVQLNEVEGRVRRVTLRTTRIETRDEGIMVIPNKEITGSTINNYSLRNLTRLRVPVDVHYDSDIAKAREVMLSLVPEDEELVSTRPEPFVAVTKLGESGVTMDLVFFITDPRERIPLLWRLNEAVLLAFRKHGIEITYPHVNVHMRS